ncbi:MAG: proline--tRNA ligase [Methanobacteriota archaeon]
MPDEVARPRKTENFSEWYNDLVERADLIDKRYPIKGCDVWRPYGLKAMRRIDSLIHHEMGATQHEEVQFPLLIPQTEFQKEADHIKGFGANVYWVTKGGESDLDVPLLLRPTSETAMYPMFSLWVRTHADLPLKIYQIVNVFRYETKQTRSFIRVREIHFFEAHTCHVDYDDAERQIHQDLEVMGRFAKRLCLPYTVCKRPEWDKFAGAYYSLGCDVFLPEAGRALQVASIHQYRDNFAKPYGITFETAEGGRSHAHQTTYGMSERLFGAMVLQHGDDLGLMMPPEVAPIQAVVIPILFKDSEAAVRDAAVKATEELSAAGVRTHLDEEEKTAGEKFYGWDTKGVPVRIEIGPKDLEKGSVVLARRDRLNAKGAREKAFVPRGELVARTKALLSDIQAELWRRAVEKLKHQCKVVKTAAEAKTHEGVSVVGWCGSDDCGLEIEKAADKTVLGEPQVLPIRGHTFEPQAGAVYKELTPSWVGAHDYKGGCGHCGKATTRCLYVARTF